MKLPPRYNIWNKWDPLKVCMLGNNYAPEFFDGLPSKTGDPLKRICEETLEDLEGFKETLQQFGVQVVQPKTPGGRFLDDPRRYPRGPLQPRDAQLVLGNTAYVCHDDHPLIAQALKDYDNNSGSLVVVSEDTTRLGIADRDKYALLQGADYPSYEDYIANVRNRDFFKPHVWDELQTSTFREVVHSSASTFPIGKDIYIDRGADTDQTTNDADERLYDLFHEFRVNSVNVHGSHIDGCFHPIKPGAILSLHEIQTYKNTFPGWDVLYLEDESYDKVRDWWNLKKKNRGKWWLAGEENNDEFTNFVETWLQDWVGYVEESVFDVNVLVIDEHHVCISNPHNELVNTFLKKHNMEPVYVPWRHRYFWDGGLHCITLDLYREGVQQDYFPDRQSSIQDQGYEW